jgi:F0F1-type ATP synthase membrane subunit b/b'
MKKEELVALGIDEEVVKKIMAINGTDIENAKAKAGQATEKVSQELENLKSQLSEKDKLIEEANVQIENFKGMDIEGTKKAADEWKTKFEQTQNDLKAKEEEYKNQLQQKDYEFKVNDIISQHKFVDDFAKDAFKKNLIDQAFKFGEDGTLQGANDYINKFKEDHKGIFVVEEAPSNEPPAPQFTNPVNNQQPPQNNGFNFHFNAVRSIPKE